MSLPHELETAIEAPTLADVYQARKLIYQHLKPTPVLRSTGLSELTGADIFVKCENILYTTLPSSKIFR